MTGPTDWRAQRYAAKSPAWLEGYRAYTPMATFPPAAPLPNAWHYEYRNGWMWAEFDYDEARDRAREDRQHYPASPMSAFERNRP